jgi:hypothetical protein
MRVSVNERERGIVIPAAIVVPDAGPVIEQMVGYLAPYTYDVLAPMPTAEEVLVGGPGDGPVADKDNRLLRRFVVEAASESAGHTVTVALHDGTIETVDKLAHDFLAANLEALNVPGIYATRILVADRLKVAQLLQARPFDQLPEPTFGNITDGERRKADVPTREHVAENDQ